MKVVIASGKGGTGKTLLAVNLAIYLANERKIKTHLLDCDVDGANDALFIKPANSIQENVIVYKPTWSDTKCDFCNKCVEVCHYHALAKVKNKILVFNELCHSCGACTYFCPTGSLTKTPNSIGTVSTSKISTHFEFTSGELAIGETLAPRIVSAVKDFCIDDGINIIDASPGTACTVVKTLENCDLALLITEATPFGKHDLELTLQLLEKMKIPVAVIVNRSTGQDEIIKDLCDSYNVSILASIPFDREYAEAYSQGTILVERFPPIKRAISLIADCCISLNAQIPKKTKKINSQNIEFSPLEQNSSTVNITEIVILSGKGGTGKTTLTAALAELMPHLVLSDCDVDAANLHLLLHPTPKKSSTFKSNYKAVIDKEKCTECGLCHELCQFEAIEKKDNVFTIVADSCEGCLFCLEACPSKAISSILVSTGETYLSTTLKQTDLLHADLIPGADNSGKLVTRVRDNAKNRAHLKQKKLILTDGPPGSSCPAISSLTGASHVILITEPTLSGVHDMKRVHTLAKYFQGKCYLVINKADLNPALTKDLYKYAKDENLTILGEIPYDPEVYYALQEGKNLITHQKGAALNAIYRIFNKLTDDLKPRSDNV